ncbi:hypothetical protein LWI29_009312 [Acer saccharum]|uniref:Uncharacterized protein n=1 Tax=Acer saccharum TaxID=4024 RepID=A0AA39SFN3_ACESA|nr:hypothetical protein LWI29_009312 [Acer saccharum]
MFNEPGNKTVADSVEEDQLNQDKGDDNMGMEDEDIADELERNLEQVSDTYMIDLEPLPSGPSNEKDITKRLGIVRPKKFARLASLPAEKKDKVIQADIEGGKEKLEKMKKNFKLRMMGWQSYPAGPGTQPYPGRKSRVKPGHALPGTG